MDESKRNAVLFDNCPFCRRPVVRFYLDKKPAAISCLCGQQYVIEGDLEEEDEPDSN